MKSEPDAYGIDDLRREGTTLWDGIRNYQARNFMRSMEVGDQAFFYHSNCKPPGIIGLMEVMETGLVDPTQFDPTAKYYDPQIQPRETTLGLRTAAIPRRIRRSAQPRPAAGALQRRAAARDQTRQQALNPSGPHRYRQRPPFTAWPAPLKSHWSRCCHGPGSASAGGPGAVLAWRRWC